MLTDNEVILLIIFYLIPSFICLYNQLKEKDFKSEGPFYKIWLVIYCFIPFSNFYEMIRIIFKMQYSVKTSDDLEEKSHIHFKLQIYLLIIGLTFSYFYLSKPSFIPVANDSAEVIGYESIAVNELGEIKGINNKIRELLQGKRFWQNQLKEINHEIEKELNEPQRQKKVEQEAEQAVKKIEQSLEEYYNKYPEKRPSLTRSKADELRAQASQIELNEKTLLLERVRLGKIAKLNKICAIVQAKINE
jgi:hypothetical protein